MAGYLIVGLGNPDPEHVGTRHNTGRMLVERLHATHDFSDWKEDRKPPMLTAKGTIGGKKVTLLLPNTYMNNSGKAAVQFVKSAKDAERTVVVYDDMDLPLGTLKISYGRSSGGHNGVESIIRSLKTRDFVRVRIGVSAEGKKGMAKKPAGEEKILKFLLGKFTPDQQTELKKVFKRGIEAVELIVSEGHQNAMTHIN